MERTKLLNSLLKVKPNILMSLGLVLMSIVGILGEYFSWSRLPLTPFSNIFGGILLLFGWLYHLYCHKFHRQAHEEPGQIRQIVTTGPFAKIRHPMYLSLMLMAGGLVIAWGIVWMIVPLLLFIGWIGWIIFAEERFLLQTLGIQYEEYKRQVPWRLIPKIF